MAKEKIAGGTPVGMHPDAWAAYQASGVPYERIGQTVGDADASVGVHLADGKFTNPKDGKQYEYTAAVDLRIGDLDEAGVWALLGTLSVRGFAAFYRKPGSDGWPSNSARHVHAVFCGVKMKAALQQQVRDYLMVPPKNGLAHHHKYSFFAPSKFARSVMRPLFEKNHSLAG